MGCRQLCRDAAQLPWSGHHLGAEGELQSHCRSMSARNGRRTWKEGNGQTVGIGGPAAQSLRPPWPLGAHGAEESQRDRSICCIHRREARQVRSWEGDGGGVQKLTQCSSWPSLRCPGRGSREGRADWNCGKVSCNCVPLTVWHQVQPVGGNCGCFLPCLHRFCMGSQQGQRGSCTHEPCRLRPCWELHLPLSWICSLAAAGRLEQSGAPRGENSSHSLQINQII